MRKVIGCLLTTAVVSGYVFAAAEDGMATEQFNKEKFREDMLMVCLSCVNQNEHEKFRSLWAATGKGDQLAEMDLNAYILERMASMIFNEPHPNYCPHQHQRREAP